MVGIKAGQLILSLSILVILHEFGHYITARWFGCRVEKFYLFFDPWFSLFKKKIGDTEYGVGWLPLGGYVKISGMVDESLDTEALKQPPKEWEFRSKPAWQRLIIMLGGIIMNVLVAIFIYAMVLYVWGEKKIPMSSLKYGITFQDSLFYHIGFRPGDKIVTVDGKEIPYFDDLTLKIITGHEAVVEREGVRQTIQFPETLIGDLISRKNKSGLLFEPRLPAMLGSFDGLPSTPAKEAGLQQGDQIIRIDSTAIVYFDEIRNVLTNTTNNEVAIDIVRNQDTLHLKSKLTDEKKLGITSLFTDFKTLDSMGLVKIETKRYGLLASIPAGYHKTKEKLMAYIDQFRLILSPKTGAYKGLGGFKAIANAFPAVWDLESFWSMTALLSIILAFMNLLPIPALDGGHVMFTLYEMITRRNRMRNYWSMLK
jgi:Predicted membrane-associated Zn-dependent proteases 1